MRFRKKPRYIDDFAAGLPPATWISCNVKDFTVWSSDPGWFTSKSYLRQLARIGKRMDKKDLFTLDEIFAYLKKLEEKTGGKRDWRIVEFKGSPAVLFNIHFYKVSEDGPLYMAYYSPSCFCRLLKSSTHSLENVVDFND